MKSKRVDIVRIQVIKERSFLYPDRKVSSPQAAVKLFLDFLEDKDREYLMVAYLNTKNEPIAIETVSIGTLNASLVHPREVFKGAILSNANSVMVAHNHPSGDPTPSQEDKVLTERLVESGKIMGIEVIDHIIIGKDEKYFSFNENGLL
jgi:DNA repair protein RadC